MTSMIAAKVSTDARGAGSGAWAVVPIKRLSAAKQRLTALLEYVLDQGRSGRH